MEQEQNEKTYAEAPLLTRIPHPTARNATVTRTSLPSGSIVATVPALSSCLIPSQKGRRCDGCHCIPTRDTRALRKCTGCASFWYCGEACQLRDWKAHHKKMCKRFNNFVAAAEYQTLSEHDRVDALLLSQLVANSEALYKGVENGERSPPYAIFMDLLPGPVPDSATPPVCLPRNPLTTALAEDLYPRFGNNNFILHSHLNTYAHGIFPLSSRLFNHSCVPNAACKYILNDAQPVTMEVVTLRDLPTNAEVTIPYLDPALPFKTRQDALRMNYGFTCDCPLCALQRRMEPVPAPPSDPASLRTLEGKLRAYVFGTPNPTEVLTPHRPDPIFAGFPEELFCLFHESYLPSLSERFSKASHEGPPPDAVDAGLTLLALYFVVYPPKYPQTGMHALELAKTAWNLVVTYDDNPAAASHTVAQWIACAAAYHALAKAILRNFGPEGDGGGPLDEIRVLGDLLNGA